MASRIMNAVLKRWGPVQTKQRIWDHEYENGNWCHLDIQDRNGVRRDLIYVALERYSEGASILDMGCGTASTALELESDYSYYLGIDISEVAIQKARAFVAQDVEKARKTRFAVGDLATFDPGRKFQVIIYRECLYYFPRHEIRQLLVRSCCFLEDGGVMVVRLHDRNKYQPIVDMIEREYAVIERLAPAGATEIVIVFPPKPAAVSGQETT